jgi:hypothetical protein
MPLDILTAAGLFVRTDNASNFAYVWNGFGGSSPEQFLAYRPSNPGDLSLVQPFDTVALKSVQTGQWCRLVPTPSNTSQMGMLCDQAAIGGATPLTYQGDGLSYNGIDLVATALGQPLLLENGTAAAVNGPTADNLALVPAPVGQ